MHMLWSDVFLVRFEFVEEGVFHGGELILLDIVVLLLVRKVISTVFLLYWMVSEP
jgi:hypothetical protein